MGWSAALTVGAAAAASGCFQPVEVPIGPCTGEDDDGVLRVCVWALESDLSLLAARPFDHTEVPAGISINGVAYDNAELEVHGGLARTFDKLSYRIRFSDGASPLVDFFGEGLEPTKRIVLQASWVDRTFARAKLAMDLTREEGGLAPRIGHAQLYLNGQWHGLYLAIERIDESFLERAGADPGQYLFKAETNTADWTARPTNPLDGFRVVKGDPLGASAAMLDFMSAMAAASLTDVDYEEDIAPRLDMQDWYAWHLVMTYCQNTDTFIKNYYLYLNTYALSGSEEARVRLIQWDADGTFGNNWDGEPLPASDPSFVQWYGHGNVFARRFFQVPGHRNAYLDRYGLALDTNLGPAALNLRVDEIAGRIRPFAEQDLARWQPDHTFDAEMGRLRGYFDDRYVVMSDLIATQMAAP